WRPGPTPSQAMIFTKHDAVGVIVALGTDSSPEDLDAWRRIDNDWREAGGAETPPPGILGTASVWTALCDLAPELIVDTIGHKVEKAMPFEGIDNTAVSLIEQGFAVWRSEREDERREYAVVAPRNRHTILNQWLWWNGERELSPFGRCLIYATKLHYEFNVFRSGMRGIRRRR